ncbi:hypothetical protein VB713_20450 [Anabaena cylindrica UHCC 0172]|nr:hypothetical protein [Anabaena cylindrica UHCC 0172]
MNISGKSWPQSTAIIEGRGEPKTDQGLRTLKNQAQIEPNFTYPIKG